jgi:hypothetical protein
MNLRFLGDSLDHWKGSVFESLQSSKVLENLRVDAMASDFDNWHPEDWSLYAKLLRVQESQILAHKVSFAINRRSYFEEIPGYGDLFLDPDIGIKPPSSGNIPQYVKHEELFFLMNQDRRRVVTVYQHGTRTLAMRPRVGGILARLRSADTNCSCASYYSSQVALLFFSFTRDRIEALSGHFHKFLGSHAANRFVAAL